MAFTRNNLARLGSPNTNAPAIWSYTSADAIATVNTSGYFNNASKELAVRDIIFVTDSATPTASICIVLSNAAGVVDISDGTTIAETDTD
jgi:hypothetical protein